MLARRKMYYSFLDFFKMMKYLLLGQQTLVVQAFEKKISEYFNEANVITTASGREAIVIALKSLGLVPGDEIIVPALTLGELIPLLKKEGYTVVLADVDEYTFNVTAKSISKVLTLQTKCIMVTHLFGVPVEMTEIMNLAKDKNIKVLEDCAHAMFAQANKKAVGLWGDISILSFEGNKPLPAYGGGAIITTNPDLISYANKVLGKQYALKFPILKKYIMTVVEELFLMSPLFKPVASVLFSEKFQVTFEKYYRGMNDKVRPKSRFTSFQAEVGLENFERYKKKQNENHDKKLLLESHLDLKKYRVQKYNSGDICSFYNTTILCDDAVAAKKIKAKLFKEGYDSGIGSEVIDSCDKYFEGTYQSQYAKQIEDRILLLPIHDGTSNRDVKSIAKLLNEF